MSLYSVLAGLMTQRIRMAGLYGTLKLSMRVVRPQGKRRVLSRRKKLQIHQIRRNKSRKR